MEDFGLWFETGVQHILDWDALDHILYVLALSIPFRPANWKHLALVITGFTLGHSVTLALSTLDYLSIKPEYVEIAIALTIILSCLVNLKDLKSHRMNLRLRYLAASVFGCIHGLGFSFLLKSMLGRETSILFPLFSFNLGLECGQMVILACVLAYNTLLVKLNENFQEKSTTTITFVILALSLYFLIQRTSLIFTNS